MTLGERLLELRKKEGLSQEDLALKLDVARQTISKWETDQSIPELLNVQLLCKIYGVSYDYLVSGATVKADTHMEQIAEEIDWSAAWSKKYPILASYQNIENINKYVKKIDELYEECKDEFMLSDENTVLILKDILYQKFKASNRKGK